MKTSSKLRRLQRIRKLRRQRRTFFIVLSIVLMLISTSAFSKTDSANDSCSVETIVVQPGDSLWSIASEYKPDGKELRDFVYEIADNNGLSDCSVICGQTLYIPVAK